MRHKKIEHADAPVSATELIQPSPKRAKTGFFNAFEEFVNAGPPAPSGSQAVPAASDSMGHQAVLRLCLQQVTVWAWMLL
jgi:hypothetical protein